MDGASSIQSADLSWLDKPDVFRVNRLDAHSDHRCYATQDEVERDSSSLIMPLDGTWKFKYSPNPQARPSVSTSWPKRRRLRRHRSAGAYRNGGI